MRLFSHTCSNTEIVCALDCADLLVGIDTDSDHPAEAAQRLPKLGRDLDLDTAGVIALRPDLVLTSLTVPGHERIVAELQDAGLRTLVCDPRSLEDVYGDIRRIAEAIGVPGRGNRLVDLMRAAMPPVKRARRPAVLVEWWPKPVIAPARQSWVSDLIELAGGTNPWRGVDAKSLPLDDAQVLAAAPEAVVMSWCGVKQENYRADIVKRRAGWEAVPAVRHQRIVPITEAWLGRPGPRLVEGYAALRRVIAGIQDG
ncbi:MAG: ABC transporter substrate-binding protein [Nevskia sp.]|nr:ABC transporter substrate-binding protein [Nevskia sp.]